MKMIRLWNLLTIVIISMIFLSSIVYAQGKEATSAQAKEQVKKMAAHVKAVGCEKAFADFNKANGPWINPYSNVYSSVIDGEGLTLVHGMYAFLVGQNHLSVKDADGNSFVKDVIAQCMKSSPCQTHYKWMAAKTSKVEARTLYYEVVDCAGKKINVGMTYLGTL
jgi:cytochrome c